MADALTKEQAIALNDIALKAVFFPLLMHLLLVIALLAPVFLMPVFFPVFPEVKSPEDGLALFLLIATVIALVIVSRFAVSKSLFKARKKGQLIVDNPEQIFASYRLRWFGWAMLGHLGAGALIILIEQLLGVSTSSIGAVATLVALYLANYMVAQKMITTGDASLNVK